MKNTDLFLHQSEVEPAKFMFDQVIIKKLITN